MSNDVEQQVDDDLVRDHLPEGDCSEVESIRWVANNISRLEVKPDECPSAVAWTLLLECRKNAEFRYDFLTKMWPKLLPSKAQMDGEFEGGELDGQPTMDLIGRLQSLRDEVEQAEVIEPDPEYESFEDFVVE